MSEHSDINQTQRAVLGDKALYALLSHNSDGLIHGVLEFNGRIDEAILARAVRASLDAEPVLGCRLVKGFWRLDWRRRADLDEAPYFSLRETNDPATLEDFLVTPASPELDPLVQVRLIRGRDGDCLCVKVQHIVADGRAVMEYLYLLAEIHGRMTLDPAYWPPVNRGSRSLRQLLTCFCWADLPGILRRAWRNQRALYSPPSNWRLPLAEAEAPRFFLTRRVDPLTCLRLRGLGRSQGATLNDIALTAVFRAFSRLAEASPGIPQRLIGTVDLRRYLPDRRAWALSNFSAFYYLRLGEEAGLDFSATLGQVRDQMNSLKGDYLGVGDIPGWLLPLALPPGMARWLIRFLFSPGRLCVPPVLTNLGAFDPWRLAFGRLRPVHAWAAAPVIFPPTLGIALSGFGEDLTFCLGSCGSENRALLESLLDLILAELEAASEPLASVA